MSSPIKYPEKVAAKTNSEIVRLLMMNKNPYTFTIYLVLAGISSYYDNLGNPYISKTRREPYQPYLLRSGRV